MLSINIDDTNTEFEWPVDVAVIENKRHVTKTFTAKFLLLDSDELEDIKAAEARKLKSQEEGIEEDFDDDSDLPERVLVGWASDLTDANTKEPIPFNDETKRAVLRNIQVRAAITRSYLKAIFGTGRNARRGNSK